MAPFCFLLLIRTATGEKGLSLVLLPEWHLRGRPSSGTELQRLTSLCVVFCGASRFLHTHPRVPSCTCLFPTTRDLPARSAPTPPPPMVVSVCVSLLHVGDVCDRLVDDAEKFTYVPDPESEDDGDVAESEEYEDEE